jgi:uncharacterized protein
LWKLRNLNEDSGRLHEGAPLDFLYAIIGLVVGILVGFMGVGGGVILIPMFVYVVHMNQHMAQGTSLFLQLPPLGLGALWMYRKQGQVNLIVGSICAVGFLFGGYFGSKIAIGLSSKSLREWFGFFLIVAAALLWRNPAPRPIAPRNGA